MAFTWTIRQRKPRYEEPEQKTGDGSLLDRVPADRISADRQRASDVLSLSDIRIEIEDGLLMAFGPAGDPVPPQNVKDACARQPRAALRLPGSAAAVDHRRLIDLLDAQQRGPLADRKSDRWIESLLGAAGEFEETPTNLLATEVMTGKRASGDAVTLDLPFGMTITLRDAHPGQVQAAALAKVVIDDQSRSIRGLLGRADAEHGADDRWTASSRARSAGSIMLRNDEIVLALLGQGEARLEEASQVWSQEPKTVLTSSDGRQLSIDDLLAMLRSEEDQSLTQNLETRRQRHPLLSDDVGLDLEQATIVTVSDLPDGWSLTRGKCNGQGIWVLDPLDLENADVVIGGEITSQAAITIKAMSAASSDGRVTSQDFTVLCPASSSKPITFLPGEIQAAAAADALLLRRMPEEVSLSAGLYDPTIKGWILKADDLEDLVMSFVGRFPGGVEIELTVVHLRGDREPHAELIATKTIGADA